MLAVNISLTVLQIESDQRYSQANCRGTWSVGKCWLDEMKPLAVAALLALEDVNSRNGRYVPQLASDAMRACDKQLVASFSDSESVATASVKAIVSAISNDGDGQRQRPHMIIGPANSAAAIPTAILAGVEDIPQLSYWATSSELSSTSAYPRFMRTVPTDDATSFAVCSFWAKDLGYKHAAVVYVADSYGRSFRKKLISHCQAAGMLEVDDFPFDSGSRDSLEGALHLVGDSGAPNMACVLPNMTDALPNIACTPP
jgi:phosphatidylinositol phospholipase C, delta